MEINLGQVKDFTKEIAQEGSFWDRFKSVEKDDKKIFDDALTPSNKEIAEKGKEIAEKEVEKEVENERKKERGEVAPDTEKEIEKEEPKQELSPEIQRMQARAQELQKEIELISKELANSATLAMERAEELVIKLAKIMAELLKIYATMVQQSGQQYR